MNRLVVGCFTASVQQGVHFQVVTGGFKTYIFPVDVRDVRQILAQNKQIKYGLKDYVWNFRVGGGEPHMGTHVLKSCLIKQRSGVQVASAGVCCFYGNTVRDHLLLWV